MIEPLPKSLADNPRIDTWLSFGRHDRVLVRTGKVEIGQGITTALAQIVAEELDVDVDRVDVESGKTIDGPDEGYTVGSLSVEVGGGALRLVAAAARQLFLDTAARLLQSRPDALSIVDGAIRKNGVTTGMSYWSLADQVDLAVEAGPLAQPKSAQAYRIVGRSVPQRNFVARITGDAFIHDLAPAGMLHGAILRPPRHGARLKAIDHKSIERLEGVVATVVDGSLIGIIARSGRELRSAVGRSARYVQWNLPPEVPADPTRALITATAPWESIHTGGMACPASTRRFASRYSRPFIAHGSIGPSCALAMMTDGHLRVWAHSQGVFPLRRAIATAMKICDRQVHIEHVPGAGCYGHNGADDAAFEASFLAKAAPGRPVRVAWTRAEEMAWSPCGSAMATDIEAALDASGRIAAFDVSVTSGPHGSRPGVAGSPNLISATYLADPHPLRPSDPPAAIGGGADRNGLPIYDIPSVSLRKRIVADFAVRTSSLRTLGAQLNIFAIESTMDELAKIAGRDALEFRLEHLRDDRAKAVLRRVADAAGWPGPSGDGVALGIGLGRYKNRAGYCAVAAEVECGDEVRARRIWACVDAGLVINPDGVANQVEGGIIQATSWTLKEALPFDEDGIAARSWDAYPILKFSETPSIVVDLIDAPRHPPLGVGEVSQGPTTAAIANAVARAIGVRIVDLPLSRDRITSALA